MHQSAAAPAERRHVAGGYLHVIGTRYDTLSSQIYHAFARSLETVLAGKVGRRHWELAFILQDVELNLDGGAPCRGPSLAIRFYASASNGAASRHSREALIGALDAAFAQPLALRTPLA